MDDKRLLHRAAAAWDRKTVERDKQHRLRWWHSRAIISHVARNICGHDAPTVNQALVDVLSTIVAAPSYERGLSVGCGMAHKEFALLQRGVVQHFDLYEISPKRVEIIHRKAHELKLENRISVYSDDFFQKNVRFYYDFVHWDNSLHHMLDVRHAVLRSHRSLRKGGCFFLNDYVGKNRFQWTDEEIGRINEFRAALPEEVLHIPSLGRSVPRSITRPPLEHMLSTDPTEAADSEAILPALHEFFSPRFFKTTGGVLYHPGLNDILYNIPDDSPLLASALAIDDALDAAGHRHYAVALAFKE